MRTRPQRASVTYPRPEHDYAGARIGHTFETSEADFAPEAAAPAAAPNIVLILLDDVGFGQPSAFGGLVEMPTADRLAASGIRYNQFHTAALCSPTRAALLTGRNHHTAHFGTITELATGFPGYDAILPRSCANLGELLHANGYATGWWGKNHNVPDNHLSEAGPFDGWPTNRGFDYFYGFFAGETDQFHPNLYRGTQPVEADRTAEQGYQLSRDLAGDCIGWVQRQKSLAPDRPLFVHFAPGAAHTPHQPPLDWRGRNAGRFEMGWDEYRRIVHERQLEDGLIPPGTGLTERPEEIPAWDTYSEEEQRLFSRYAENYADFLSHTDHEIGRVLDQFERLGELDNTLVVYLLGDNGASAEGTLTGLVNEFTSINGIEPDVSHALDRIDEIGLPGTAPHYPTGWAWAGDAPFKWVKQIASHFGCTRNGAIFSWPRRITDVGTVRSQFHHVIDVVPTVLELLDLAEPTMVDGVAQKPIEGVSMAYTFAAEAAGEPSTRHTQYFEMGGHRALYHDGWIASCRHGRLPWGDYEAASFADDRWELYDISSDFSQHHDLAAEHPEKLAELQDLFMIEAAKHGVFPLDDRWLERLDVTMRPSSFHGRDSFTLYPGMVRLPEGSAPKTHNVSHTITVDAELPAGGAEGVLVCLGGETGGWSLFVDAGRLVYHYNWVDLERYEVVSAGPLPTGRVELRCEFENLSDELGGPALLKLRVDGELVAEGTVDKQVRGRFSLESLDVGLDALSAVTPKYAARLPFAFTGTLHSVRFDFGAGAELTRAERVELGLKLD